MPSSLVVLSKPVGSDVHCNCNTATQMCIEADHTQFFSVIVHLYIQGS